MSFCYNDSNGLQIKIISNADSIKLSKVEKSFTGVQLSSLSLRFPSLQPTYNKVTLSSWFREAKPGLLREHPVFVSLNTAWLVRMQYCSTLATDAGRNFLNVLSLKVFRLQVKDKTASFKCVRMWYRMLRGRAS